MTNTQAQAVDFAYDQVLHGPAAYHELCLGFAMDAYGVRAAAASWGAAHLPRNSARAVWDDAVKRGHAVVTTDLSQAPYGALCFSGCTQTTFGHVFVIGGRTKTGERVCYSTDVARSGHVDRVPPSWFGQHWGHQINGWVAVEAMGQTLPYGLHASPIRPSAGGHPEPKDDAPTTRPRPRTPRGWRLRRAIRLIDKAQAISESPERKKACHLASLAVRHIPNDPKES